MSCFNEDIAKSEEFKRQGLEREQRAAAARQPTDCKRKVGFETGGVSNVAL
jgi:hypothetical protein